ncbi:transposase family protein [Anabaena sp. UHCC 0187]|uniref:transposase family protein n=1 Tax=Anabaena sp. UHCC 0187 TaxID=2590018 RepID=UPI00352A725A
MKIEQENSFSTCPKCGTTSHKLYQNHRHIIKDLPFAEKEVFLEVNRRQFKCKQFQRELRSNREQKKLMFKNMKLK